MHLAMVAPTALWLLAASSLVSVASGDALPSDEKPLLRLFDHGAQQQLRREQSRVKVDVPESETQNTASKKKRKLTGKFLHISDFHPDEFYRYQSKPSVACHRGQGHAGYFGTEKTECDSPLSLVNATFDWIEANLRDEIDFIIWTGDSARHDGDEKIPRHAKQVLSSNQMITNKFLEVFRDPDTQRLTIPIVPTFGNNDILPHNILLPGPNRWLQYYARLWKPFIPEEQLHLFQYGGWFRVDVIPEKLSVFSINTLYFFDRNAGIDNCVEKNEPGYHQFEWLRAQLTYLRSRGMKAILMGHVPPARTKRKQLWDETCWQRYNIWARQFRDVIVGSVYGHMNIDHFLIHDSRDRNIFHPSDVQAEEANEVHEEEVHDDEQFIYGSIHGKAKYLRDIRTSWHKLPNTRVVATDEVGADGGTDGGNAVEDVDALNSVLGGKYAERYHISLVGPSIIPNYFPSLRVFEYNIDGLEEATAWSEVPVPAENDEHDSSVADSKGSSQELSEEERYSEAFRHPLYKVLDDTRFQDLQDESLYEDLNEEANTVSTAFAEDENTDEGDEDMSSSGKKKKKKKKKKPRPHDPTLLPPKPPARHAPPGPAYSIQPLSFLGYTQYFANLTEINDEKVEDDTDDAKTIIGTGNQELRRRSDTNDQNAIDAKAHEPSIREEQQVAEAIQRRRKQKPNTTLFEFRVEYSTFTDPVLAMKDLTVSSYLRLAHRMKEIKIKVSDLGSLSNHEDDEQDYHEDEEEDELEDEYEDESDTSEEEDEKFIDGHESNEPVFMQKESNVLDDSEDGSVVYVDDLNTVKELRTDEGNSNDSEGKKTSGKKGKKGKGKKDKKKKKKKKKQRHHNEVWHHWLKFAFVSILSAEELEDL